MKKYAGAEVSFEGITLTDGFWKVRQELVRDVTIDAVYDRFKETGRFEALTCSWKEGDPNKPHIFWESDVTKWIEGAAFYLQKKRDPQLEARIDELIRRMKESQEENGYLNTYFTVVEPEARFTRRTDHELYCAGHLIEGAIAYAKATGKTAMLDIAVKYTDLIDRVFRIEKSAKFDTPGHQEIELALVKLYEFTGEERYKLLSEYFIDTRGTSERDETYDFTDQEHMQSHLPVREQVTAEGHSVRALYMYCAMADLARLNQDQKLADVCSKLFHNIVDKRMYITGGIGSTHRGESFTFDYDLPEYTAYNETCASIGLALFCKRMWLIEADRKYADCAEQALYNTVLSGVSLSGDKFFYENPIAVDPRRAAFNHARPQGLQEHLPIMERVKVFDCSCCPPNIVRITGSIGDYMYSSAGDTIYAHCYMNGEAQVDIEGRKVHLSQKTDYPFDGDITLVLHTAGRYQIAMRIPGWCDRYQITVNGSAETAAEEGGYVYLNREWKEQDRISLDLEMEVRLYEANPLAADCCGKVAVARGPLVFCAEGMDHSDRPLRDIRIKDGGTFTVGRQIIDGVELPVLSGEAEIRKHFDGLYRPHKGETEKIEMKLLPYFAWANRGITEMTTWFIKG